MINYQLYAFKMAMDEALYPGAEYARGFLFEKEVPNIIKNSISKDRVQAKESFSAAIDGFKKNLNILDVDSLWGTINPVVPLTEKIMELDNEIQEIEEQLVIESSPIEERFLTMRRNSLLNRLSENADAASLHMDNPIYAKVIDTMTAYKKHTALRLPKATDMVSKKVPLEWVFNEHFTPHMN